MRVRRDWLVVLLLLAGAGLVVWFGSAGMAVSPPLTLVLLAAGLAVGAIPTVAGWVGRRLERVRHLPPDRRRLVTLAVWAAATLYLAGTAYFHARDLFPRLHDEQSYMLGARMLARGRLWMPQHPLADFFDSFHILVRPVYASIYFPGTALMNVPGVWLGLPTWVVPVVAAGLVVALVYRVTAELVDEVSGLLAALVVVSVGWFRTYSTMVMAQVPAALLCMLLVWAWLHWRKGRRLGWALAVGVFAGWAAITRPVDALAFAVPVGLAMVLDLLCGTRGEAARERRAPPSLWLRTALAVVAGAAPFLALQVAFDLRVTGRALRTPYVFYLERYQPSSVFGVSSSGTTRPADVEIPGPIQKQVYYQELVEDERAERAAGWWHWLSGRLLRAAECALPGAAFALLLPVAVLGLGRRRWVAAAAVPLFLALYLFNPYFLPHYAVPLAAPAAFLVVLGLRTLAAAPKSPAVRNALASALTLGVIVLCARSLPELQTEAELDGGGRPPDQAYSLPTVSLAEGVLRQEVKAPAVLLFRYHPGLSPHDEPVYNSDVAWPDDAPVVRAHDLGPRNAELFRYYGSRQPARRFYLFDRGDNSLYDLGTAEQALRPEVPNGKLGPPVQKFGQ